MSRTAQDTNLFVVVTGVCPSHGFMVGIVPQHRGWMGVRITASRGKTASQKCEKLLCGIKDSPAAFLCL